MMTNSTGSCEAHTRFVQLAAQHQFGAGFDRIFHFLPDESCRPKLKAFARQGIREQHRRFTRPGISGNASHVDYISARPAEIAFRLPQ